MDGFPNNEHSPREVKFPCGTCAKAVRSADRGVFCKVCLYWFHYCCVSICAWRYKELQDSEGGCSCPTCTHSALPFADCSRLSLGDDRKAIISCPSLSSTSSSTVAAFRLSGLFVYYAHCRSILPKMEDLLCLVASPDSPTVIALTETWLDSSIAPYEVELPSYRLYRRDRSRHGGKVAMYVHESANVSLFHPISERLSVTVQSSVRLFLFAVLYQPPGTDFDLSQLDQALL